MAWIYSCLSLQVPEQDESYLADSFCVEDEEEEAGPTQSGSSEGEEVCANFDLVMEESFVNGRKQYYTRRREKLKAQRQGCPPSRPKKPSRILVLDSSSEDEGGGIRSGGPVEALPNPDGDPGAHAAAPSPALGPSTSCRRPAPEQQTPLPQEDKSQAHLAPKASLSEELDFHPQRKAQGAASLRETLQVELSLPSLPDP